MREGLYDVAQTFQPFDQLVHFDVVDWYSRTPITR